MPLGDKIRTLRKKLGLTQQELAALTGITQATLSRIESGRVKRPRSDYLRRIAGALHVSMDELVDLPDPRLEDSRMARDNRARYIFRGYERLDEARRDRLIAFIRKLEREQEEQS